MKSAISLPEDEMEKKISLPFNVSIKSCRIRDYDTDIHIMDTVHDNDPYAHKILNIFHLQLTVSHI